MSLTLKQVLEAYSANGVAGITALLAETPTDDEALAALVEEARTGFADIFGDGTAAYSVEDADALETLANVLDTLTGEQGTRAEAAAQTNTRVQDLASRVLPPDGDGTDGDGGTGDASDGSDVGDTSADDAGDDAGDGDTRTRGDRTSGDRTSDDPPAAPTAARRVDVLARLAKSRATQPPPVAARTGATLIAASDVPDTPAGTEFANLRAISMAAVRRLQAMPRPMDPGTPAQMRAGLAIIQKNTPEDLIAKRDSDYEVLDYAADESRLPGKSLVAAGGWCSPSETLYGFFELEDADGMLSAPETVWARGGIKFTKGPDFATLYSNTGFAQTEAQAIADTAKTCYEVPCNDWEEERLDLIGLCIKAGILMNATYPELIDRYIRGALNAHAHRINASVIARIVALTTLVNLTTGTPAYWARQGATSGVLEAVELQVEDYRLKHRMGPGRTLEGFAPTWLRAVMRADLAKRNGVDLRTVNNAQLDSHFADRSVRLQFVYDYQDAYADAGAGLGGTTPAVAWPATVDIVLYAAGTFVKGTNDVIRLDAGIYDSVNIMTNKYNALFTEEGIAVAMRGREARRVRVPLCASGHTAAQVDLDCTP